MEDLQNDVKDLTPSKEDLIWERLQQYRRDLRKPENAFWLYMSTFVYQSETPDFS